MIWMLIIAILTFADIVVIFIIDHRISVLQNLIENEIDEQLKESLFKEEAKLVKAISKCQIFIFALVIAGMLVGLAIGNRVR